jgi:hypothetical protein
LSPLRLPVPPSRLFVEMLDSTAYFTFYVFAVYASECETVQVNVKVFMDSTDPCHLPMKCFAALLGRRCPPGQAITRTSVRDSTTQRTHSPISKLWPCWYSGGLSDFGSVRIPNQSDRGICGAYPHRLRRSCVFAKRRTTYDLRPKESDYACTRPRRRPVGRDRRGPVLPTAYHQGIDEDRLAKATRQERSTMQAAF